MRGKCAICGADFFSRAVHAKTCGLECREKLNVVRKKERRLKIHPTIHKRTTCEMCDEPIPRSRPHNAVTCSPECSKTRLRKLAAPKIKIVHCEVCNEVITDRHALSTICNKIECREEHKQKIDAACRARIRPIKAATKKDNRCQFPGCRLDKGANYHVCNYHLKMRSDSGRWDDGYNYISSMGAIRERKGMGGGI